MIDWSGVEQWVVALPQWLMLLLVFFAAFIEGMPLLGIPFPGNLIVSAVAIQAGIAHRNPMPLLAVHALGGIVADIVFFAIGKRAGLGFLHGLTSRLPRWIRYDAAAEDRLRGLLDQHGIKAVVFARISPGLRNLFAWAAGALRLRFWRMLLGAVLGGFLIAAFFVTSGYLVGRGYEQAGEILGKSLTYGVIGLIVVLAAGYLLTRRMRLFSPRTLVLGFGVLAAAPAFLALLLDRTRGWALHRWEESGGALAWLHATASWPVPRAVTGPEPFLVGLIVLMGLLARRGRWREALGVVTSTGLALGAVALLHMRLPRVAPDGVAVFPLETGFADVTAMLVILLASLVAAYVLPPPTTLARQVSLALLWIAAAAFAVLPLATGRSHLADTLAGIAFGALAACLTVLADTLVTNVMRPPEGGHLGARLILVTRELATRGIDAFARVVRHPAAAWSAIAVGVVARIAGPWSWALGPDATRYAAMGKAFLDTGSFLMPWGDVYTPGAPGMSHHFPPLYPMVLAGFYKLFGFSEDTTRIASIVLALGALGVMYATTRSFYGRVPARIATAIVALSPILVQTANKGYSENLVLMLFAGSMWGILKSLERPWYIVWGGLFAALAYLTKSSMGYFFVVAGLGGLAWRLHWKGWSVLRQRPYLVAIAVFGTAVVGWGLRNWRLFGDWQTSTHLNEAYAAALHDPASWLHLLPWSFAVMFGLGYLLFMGVLPWLPKLASIPRLANEHDSGLWLALGLPVVLTIVIDAALWNFERAFFLHNVRYVSFAIVPLVWLLLRHAQPSRRTWVALAASLGVMAVATLYYAAIPNVPPGALAADALGAAMEGDATLAFVDHDDVYRFYFDATHNGEATVDVRVYMGADARNVTQDWVLAAGENPQLPEGYSLVPSEAPAGYTIWRRA